MDEDVKISKKQQQIFELVDDPTITELLIGGSAGGATVYGHFVKTPTGEKPIENVKIGDIICNSEGTASEVIDIPYDGYIECYGVTFIDGSYTEVSRNHLWKYKRASFPVSKTQEYRIGTTEQLAQELADGKYNISVPLTEPVVFSREFKQEHRIDPYVLGVMLGDGDLGTHFRICCPDIEIINRCRTRISGEIHGPGKRGRDWYLTYCSEERQAVKDLGLFGKKSDVKFIPDRFKYGSIEEREEILKGLFDTDGSVDSRGHLKVDTTSEQMAKDVQFIIRSLGGNATLSVDTSCAGKATIIDGRIAHHNLPVYRVYIQHPHKERFVTLPRKLKRIRPYNGGRGRLHKRILKIEPVGIKHARCLTTSALDGLYLTDDFIVTHNSKTMSMGMVIAFFAKKYPGARFFVGRKTLKSLKQSTINTLLTKVHPMLGIGPDEAIMHWQTMELEYKNGSIVIFGELDYQPADPDFARIGSLEICMAFVDEAGEITLKAKNAIKSRVGRGVMANKYGIPGKVILAANPSMNFLRQEYYDPYEQLGGGGFQKWQIGEVEVSGEKKPAYRAFLRMGAYDNPFLPQSYIDNLKSLPDVERKRLLDGNWNYADDDSSLFRAGLLEKATTFEVSGEGTTFIGVDVSDVGKDRTIFSLMRNGVLTTQKVATTQMNWDKNSKLPMGRLLANELVEFAQRHGIFAENASHVAVETNGVGASVRDFLRDRGWRTTEYTATHKSRSENYYQLMLDMDAGDVKILNTMGGVDELKRELMAHSFTMNNQEPDVLKKEKIKQTLGHSPDLADSFMIANYCRNWISNPANDPRRNSNRLAV